MTGPQRSGLPGDVSDKVIAVRAKGETEGAGEVAENLFDGSSQTKSLVFEPTGWVEAELSEPVAFVHYGLISANDAAERDPRDWTLSGSNDGQSWTVLDTQTGQNFSGRFQTTEYRFANTTAYRHYRLDITANHGAGIVQLAELQLPNGDTAPPPPSGAARAAATRPSRASASPASRRSSMRARARPRAAATPTTRSSTSTCPCARRPSSLPDLPRLRRRRPQLPEHLCVGRPRLHRRYVPERPRRDRPAPSRTTGRGPRRGRR